MANYYYRIGGEDFILSEDEHIKIQEQVSKGHAFIRMRDGKLGINTANVVFFRETPKQTLIQEKEQQERLGASNVLQLGDPTPDNLNQKQSYIQRTHKEFYAKMKWEHGLDCSCKQKTQ